jgi:hypothetical protein
VIDTLGVWHQVVAQRDVRALHGLLHDDVVFHSPQRGKAITLLYLRGALQVLNTAHFHYEREVVGLRDAVLEFSTQIDGVHVNGVDLIRWDDDGRIVDFKVMVRPLKAVNALHAAMGAMLSSLSPPPAAPQPPSALPRP